MKAAMIVVLALCVASLALTGCFGQAKQDEKTAALAKPKEITQEAEKRFEELTQKVPSNYSFPLQKALDPAVAWLNGTLDVAADGAIEDANDEGGMQYGTFVKTMDVSSFVPVGQPVEIHVMLSWIGNPGQSADLDIFTDLPGHKGAFDASNPAEYNWNIPVKRMVVDTIGVEGQKALIGVQATNGRIAPGQTMAYRMEIDFDYARDVLTPYHPWAFTLPAAAAGIVLKSVKVTGDEHIRAAFAIIDPRDELVTYSEYDDIAIPTESVFIPLRGAGEYVFYAYNMEGGFLSLKADAPVPARDVHPLPLLEIKAVDFGQPLAPGIAAHHIIADSQAQLPTDPQAIDTPYQEGAKGAGFTVDKAFPLRIVGTFSDGQSVAGDAQITITSPKGMVYQGARALRIDAGDQGSVGWSGDHAPFVTIDNGQLAKGTYTVSVVADGYTGQLGHAILTYQRASGGGT